MDMSSKPLYNFVENKSRKVMQHILICVVVKDNEYDPVDMPLRGNNNRKQLLTPRRLRSKRRNPSKEGLTSD